ncbi:MAG: alpha-L-fucosidase [Negativicutes bacterium]|nr:alpha-L-fucosidase [Negativicutes bacterium]
MKEKIKNQIDNMKNQTIGVEIEMNSITRKKAAELVADFFGTRAWNAASEYGYSTWACKDTGGRVWKFQKDVSIAGLDDEKCEMVTPILKYEDINALQEIIRILRKAGAKSDATRMCGVHIHIGANGHTPKTMRNLTNIMASHESLLAESLEIDTSRIGRYCKTVDPRFLTALNKKKPSTMSSFADVWYRSQNEDYGRTQHYNGSRYHMLNFHATFTKGTIEFRLFQFDAPKDGKQNGLHAGQLKSYIQLCLALSQMAKEAKGASPKPQQNENPKYAMRTWLLRLGFIGEEFATAREFLTKKLSGDASFRSGVRPASMVSA